MKGYREQFKDDLKAELKNRGWWISEKRNRETEQKVQNAKCENENRENVKRGKAKNAKVESAKIKIVKYGTMDPNVEMLNAITTAMDYWLVSKGKLKNATDKWDKEAWHAAYLKAKRFLF